MKGNTSVRVVERCLFRVSLLLRSLYSYLCTSAEYDANKLLLAI